MTTKITVWKREKRRKQKHQQHKTHTTYTHTHRRQMDWIDISLMNMSRAHSHIHTYLCKSMLNDYSIFMAGCTHIFPFFILLRYFSFFHFSLSLFFHRQHFVPNFKNRLFSMKHCSNNNTSSGSPKQNKKQNSNCEAAEKCTTFCRSKNYLRHTRFTWAASGE